MCSNNFVFYCPRLSRKRGTLKLVCPSVRLSVRHKNFTLAHIFWSINARALIFGMYDPCDKPFQFPPCHDPGLHQGQSCCRAGDHNYPNLLVTPEPTVRIKWTIVITRCLSSVVNFFFHFRLLWNLWTEFKETWQEARYQRLLPSLCFSGRSKKNKIADMASDLLRHFRLLLWNCWTEFNEIWQEARSQRPLPSLCFSGRLEKQDSRPASDWLRVSTSLKPPNRICRSLTGSKILTSSILFGFFFGQIRKSRRSPGLLLAETVSTCSLKRNLRKHDRKKNSTFSTMFVFVGPIRKTSPPPPLGSLLWNILTKLDRKQDLNVFYQVCVFHADRKTRWPPWLRLADFSTCLKPLNRICRNLTGNKISTSSIMFFFRADKKNMTVAPSSRQVSKTVSTSSLKPLNGIYGNMTESKNTQRLLPYLCFRADWKKKIAPPPALTPASNWLRHFQLHYRNRWPEFAETWQEARI